jgi:hypothetical protein
VIVSKISNSAMAIISMFYGIIISMYYLDNKQHHLPDWQLAITGETIFKIDPLK